MSARVALRHELGWDPDFMRRSAWLWPLARAAARLRSCADWPAHAQLDQLYAELGAGRGGPSTLRFVPDRRDRRSGPSTLETSYDARIAAGEVPTRAGCWHDVLNALCFATWPRSKHALHARQHRALCAHVRAHGGRVPGARTREQDALTLFDEGGVVVAALPDAAFALCAALEEGFGGVLEASERARRVRVVVFGHALLEHLVGGHACPGASARVLCVPRLPADDAELIDALDLALARALSDPDQLRDPREARHLRIAG